MGFSRYMMGRLARSVLTVLALVVIVFGLARVSGDPTRALLSAEASQAEIDAFREELGLDEPLTAQFGGFVSDLSRGDLGESLRYRGERNLDLIVTRAPRTLALAGIAIVLALFFGLLFGGVAASFPSSFADRFAKMTALAGQSIPTFLVGILLVLFVSVRWRLLPSGSGSGWMSYLLPSLTLAWFATAAITRVTRSKFREVLGSQHVLFAQSKGLPRTTILWRHVMKNSATAVLTMAALQFVLFANGAIIVETIFNWPGVGRLAVEAAFARDFTLLQALVLMTGSLVIAVNLLTDLAYVALDKRVRLASAGK